MWKHFLREQKNLDGFVNLTNYVRICNIDLPQIIVIDSKDLALFFIHIVSDPL